jgi:Tetratrico peptide repeat
MPADNAIAVFERAGSLDSPGHSDLAVPLYRQALELGLHGER